MERKMAFSENTKTGSGWFFDYSKCYDRLYYLKRLNKNAILITAFYSRELSDALTASDDTGELQSYDSYLVSHPAK
ncbi:hypothetical protein [Clostridium sp. AF17-21AC]|jgi:hypothetical protein|nr:hypothetical protein [Clostridium sp. AF17-21AC]